MMMPSHDDAAKEQQEQPFRPPAHAPKEFATAESIIPSGSGNGAACAIVLDEEDASPTAADTAAAALQRGVRNDDGDNDNDNDNEDDYDEKEVDGAGGGEKHPEAPSSKRAKLEEVEEEKRGKRVSFGTGDEVRVTIATFTSLEEQAEEQHSGGRASSNTAGHLGGGGGGGALQMMDVEGGEGSDAMDEDEEESQLEDDAG